MKQFIGIAVLVLALITFAYVATADDAVLTGTVSTSVFDDLEILKAEAKPCILYSITENQVTYATSVQILGYKGTEINALYSTDKNMPAISLGYEVANLKDLGVDVPLAKYIDLTVFGFVGCRDFTTEDRSSDWGIGATLVKITF